MLKQNAQMRLSVLWLGAALLGGFVLFLKTSWLGQFGDRTPEVWDWYSQAMLPTATLMLGVVGSAAATTSTEKVRLGPYRLAMVTSAVYLAAVLVVIWLIGRDFSLKPMETSDRPLQFFFAVANVLIGVFFVRGSEGGEGASEEEEKGTPEVPEGRTENEGGG